MPWEALTADQQETAAKLGYAQDSWDEWEDLTEEQQQLWDVLGWTAENWATGDGVESENLSWSEMNAEQREAAEELGFVQDSWDEWDDLPAEKQKFHARPFLSDQSAAALERPNSLLRPSAECPDPGMVRGMASRCEQRKLFLRWDAIGKLYLANRSEIDEKDTAELFFS